MKRKFLSTVCPLLLIAQFAQASVSLTGKGMWIWKIWETEGGNLSTVISRLKDSGVKWLIVKCGDSDSYYNEPGKYLYNWASSYGGFSNIINQFHNNSIKVFGWHFVYSYDLYGVSGVTEADVSNKILNIPGIDGLVINAEEDYEGKGSIAEQYMQNIRANHPNSFTAYSSFARVTGHEWFPWLEFGQYCDVNMPQAYWAARLLTPEEEVNRMKSDFDYWHNVWRNSGHGNSVKPMIPVGQGGYVGIGRDIYPSEVFLFCNTVQGYGYQGVSLYAYHIMTQTSWNEYTSSWSPSVSPPTLVSPTNGSHQTCGITFQWNSIPNADRYELFVTLPDESYGNTETTSPNYPYPPGQIGEYRWKVKAFVNGTWSDYSDEWTFYFDGVNTPTLISPENYALITILNPTLEWNDVSCANYYKIEVAIDNSFNNIVALDLNVNGTTWQLNDPDITYGQTYYWHVASSSPIGNWSTTWNFQVASPPPNYPPEVISKPGTPVGQRYPTVGVSYTYTTSGASSDLGHTVEYSFNWGDGTSSSWSTSTSASHSWSTTGSKTVTVTARCQTHTDKTNTSDPLTVTVKESSEEVISKPGTPVGETNPTVGVSYTYTTSGATSNLGHTVEYSFNWGDGTSSSWSTSKSASHSWSTTGSKTVTVTARCQAHTDKTNTSDPLTVTVRESSEEVISKPGVPVGDRYPTVGVSYTYTTSGASSNLGHTVEYSFNWGDGTSSSWSTSKSASHSWSSTGSKTVTVTARCQAHPDKSNTSDPLTVNVEPPEEISKPGTPVGETNPTVGISYTYTTSRATSNLGHVLEYSFNWGDGTSSPWSTSTSASHSWSTTGPKTVSVTARCNAHIFKTNTSDPLVVNVQPVEEISKPGIPAGETNPMAGVVYTYTTSGATSNLGHTVEYSFNWGDGTSSSWSTSKSASHSWSTTGSKTVRVTARCQAHPDKSNTSDPLTVTVREPEEVISKPGTPVGETNPIVGVSYTYTTSGASSNLGHVLEYSFNWGDGTSSSWSTSPSAFHSWSTTGSKTVRVTARCQAHPDKSNTSDPLTVTVIPSTQVEVEPEIPLSFSISQNYPNPFNPVTTIQYTLSMPSEVRLEIFNLDGERVRTLVAEHQSAGYYTVHWDGNDEKGRAVGSGVYIYSLRAGEFVAKRKMILMR